MSDPLTLEHCGNCFGDRLSLGAAPVSRSTIAPAASSATPRTLLMAACLPAAIAFSASASLTLSASSIFLRAASARGRAFPCLVGDCLRAAARLGQCLFVSRDRFVRLFLEPLASAISPAMRSDGLDDRRRPAAAPIWTSTRRAEEEDREPDELRGKRLLT